MKSKTLWRSMASVLLLLAIVAVACGAEDAEEPAAPAAPAPAAPAAPAPAAPAAPAAAPAPAAPAPAPAGNEMVQNVWGEQVEKPQYGGTIPLAINGGPDQFDPWFGYVGLWAFAVLEKMADIDYSLSMSEFDSSSGFYTESMVSGEIAESWETPDPETIILHIRKGNYWHDKAPVNGRELNAYDVEWSWQRLLGLGEFAETGSSPFIWGFAALAAESVTATDEWTIEVKLHTPGYMNLNLALGNVIPSGYTIPREVIDTYGDMKEWERVVGNGPYSLTGFVPDSSVTLTRDLNYWKFDPRYPDLDLRLPYADEIKLLVIPDLAPRVAALRTGKSAMAGGNYLTLDQINSLQKTNPELVTVPLEGTSMTSPRLAVSRAPFDELDVRVAMQKAINTKEIVDVYYGGDARAEPTGFPPVKAEDHWVTYDKWSAATKDMYSYDPAAAEALLDAAGYPRRADGNRFEVTYDLFEPWGNDIDLAQIVKDYWAKIGVDVTLNQVSDSADMNQRWSDGRSELGHCTCRAKTADSVLSMPFRFAGEPARVSGITDPVFNSLVDELHASVGWADYSRLAKEMDMYFVEQMWSLYLPVVNSYMLHQPWLHDYRGREGGGDDAWINSLIVTWVDQDLKDEMGH